MMERGNKLVGVQIESIKPMIGIEEVAVLLPLQQGT